jgi:transcriptional regulator with XRE-family HTH domain
MTTVMAPNRLREERIAAGIETRRLLAARIGVELDYLGMFEEGLFFPSKEELERILAVLRVPVERIYPTNWRQALGIDAPPEGYDFPGHFELLRGPERLLVSRDEITWSEARPKPDEPVDVFVSLSCGTQATPHLLLDTVAVLRALGVRFAAAAGAAGCCGSPYVRRGKPESATAWMRAKAKGARGLGASVNVNWCTNCQLTLTKADRDGVTDPVEVRQVQILTYLEETVRALGDKVPWKKKVERRAVAEGHWAWSEVHRGAQVAEAHLLGLIPGVTVMGFYDGHQQDSPCAVRSGRPSGLPPWTPDLTADDVRARRARIAERMLELGADTVACQHQGCHQIWSAYASDVTVKHAVSILAEALGCEHPDRYQAALQAGDARTVVAQTEPNWRSWGLSEADALALATDLVDRRYAEGTGCTCGREQCADELIAVDVLTATRRPATSIGTNQRIGD